MSFAAVDLPSLPAPDFVDPLDFEAILARTKADFLARYPDAADVIDLESEPAVKLMEQQAYCELLVRQRVNDQARGVSLPFATGADLDVIASRHNVARKQIGPGDPTTVPPTPPTMEADADLRRRAQLAFEGLASAGPEGAYQSVVMGVEGVRSAAVIGPGHPRNVGVVANAVRPGEVLVVVQGHAGDGTASDDLLDAVRQAVTDSAIRTITHKVIVRTAAIRHYRIRATLYFEPGPDRTVVMAAARRAATDYADRTAVVGQSVRHLAIGGALHQVGVHRVELPEPNADLLVASHEAPFCTGIDLIDGGANG